MWRAGESRRSDVAGRLGAGGRGRTAGADGHAQRQTRHAGTGALPPIDSTRPRRDRLLLRDLPASTTAGSLRREPGGSATACHGARSRRPMSPPSRCSRGTVTQGAAALALCTGQHLPASRATPAGATITKPEKEVEEILTAGRPPEGAGASCLDSALRDGMKARLAKRKNPLAPRRRQKLAHGDGRSARAADQGDRARRRHRARRACIDARRDDLEAAAGAGRDDPGRVASCRDR